MTTLPADTSPGTSRGQAAGERYPIALVTFGVVMFSTGPVLVVSTSTTGPVFSFWRLWIGATLLAIGAGVHLLRQRRAAQPRRPALHRARGRRVRAAPAPLHDRLEGDLGRRRHADEHAGAHRRRGAGCAALRRASRTHVPPVVDRRHRRRRGRRAGRFVGPRGRSVRHAPRGRQRRVLRPVLRVVEAHPRRDRHHPLPLRHRRGRRRRRERATSCSPAKRSAPSTPATSSSRASSPSCLAFSATSPSPGRCAGSPPTCRRC